MKRLMFSILLALCQAVSFASVEDEVKSDKMLLQLEMKYVEKPTYLRFYNLFKKMEKGQHKDKWIDALYQNIDSKIEYVKNTKKFKALGEVKIDVKNPDFSILKKNLEFATSNGYNSTVFTFDCTENINDVLEAIKIIKDNKMMILAAYTGKNFFENTRWNPYAVSPDQIKSFFSQMLPACDGLVLCWRCMSIHEFASPPELFNFLSYEARQANPSIAIYGQVYNGIVASFGDTATRHWRMYVTNMNGYLVSNIGYRNINVDFMLNITYPSMFGDFSNREKICEVVGPTSYYLSKNKICIDEKEELLVKKEIEQQFEDAGCMTITYLHDGVDENYESTYSTTCNMMHDTKYIKE